MLKACISSIEDILVNKYYMCIIVGKSMVHKTHAQLKFLILKHLWYNCKTKHSVS